MASVGMTFERVEKMAQELAVFRDQNRAATSNRAIPHEEVEHAAVFLDAYLNMLQYQRIKVVNQYQADYDFLAYSMRRDHSKLAIDHVTPVKLEQPRESGDVGSYLADAADAKRILDAEVLAVVEAERAAGEELRPVKAPSFVEAPLKSEESTLRKASMPWAGGNLRLVTDMARVSVLCYSSEDLQKMCQNLRERFKALGFAVPRVANGFRGSFTPGGYRDVKMNVSVCLESGSEHLCEVQLHLEQFFALKDASHKVYEWARGLRVTCNISATHLFENVSPQVLTAMIEIAENNRAYANALPDLMRYAGYPLKVAQILRETVAEATRVYERDAVNPTTDASRRAGIRLADASSFLAQSLLDQGDADGAEEARRMCEQALQIEREIWGEDHPQVARTLNTLALVLKTQRHYQGARKAYDQSRAIMQAALGPNHPMVSSARNNISCILLDEERFYEAELMLRETLRQLEESVGDKHPNYVGTVSNLSQALQKQAKWGSAAVVGLKAVKAIQSSLGVENLKYATTLNNYAVSLQNQDQHPKAAAAFQESLGVIEGLLGKNNVTYAHTLKNIGSSLVHQKDYEGAESAYLEAVDIFYSIGVDKRDPAIAHELGAKIKRMQGDYDGARVLYDRALEDMKEAVGENSSLYATLLNNYGMMLEEEGDYNKAEERFARCLEILKRILPEGHPNCQWTHQSLVRVRGLGRRTGEGGRSTKLREMHQRAVALQKQGNHRQAAPLFGQYLEGLKASVGAQDLEYVVGLNDLAASLINLGDDAGALRSYDEAVQICRAQGIPEYPTVSSLIYNMAGVEISHDVAKAVERYDETVAILTDALPPNDEGISRCCRRAGQNLLMKAQGAYGEKFLKQALLMELSASREEGLAHIGVLHAHLACAQMMQGTQGKLEEALQSFTESLRIGRDVGTSEYPSLAHVLRKTVDVLWLQSRKEEAVEKLAEYVNILERNLLPDHQELVEARQWVLIASRTSDECDPKRNAS